MQTSVPGRVKRRSGASSVAIKNPRPCEPRVKGTTRAPYLAALAVVRRNFVVNFSTRPAVSTMRFSPV